MFSYRWLKEDNECHLSDELWLTASGVSGWVSEQKVSGTGNHAEWESYTLSHMPCLHHQGIYWLFRWCPWSLPTAFVEKQLDYTGSQGLVLDFRACGLHLSKTHPGENSRWALKDEQVLESAREGGPARTCSWHPLHSVLCSKTSTTQETHTRGHSLHSRGKDHCVH